MDYEIIEIGPFGKVHHDILRQIFTDTWMNNAGDIVTRVIQVPAGPFVIESCGKMIYQYTPDCQVSGLWFGSEGYRRYTLGES